MNNHDIRQTCPRCGTCNFELNGVNSWRWNGEHWEHRCDDLDPQIGHFRIFPDPAQKTDRELVNELVAAGDAAARDMDRYGRSSEEHMIAIGKCTDLANSVVERLIRRDERIKLLQATVDDLLKNEQTTFT